MSDQPRECPCNAVTRYKLCCRPFHQGALEAATPVILMRSRYSAFAVKAVNYLWKTLHSTHPDRLRDKDEVLRELRAAASTQRFVELRILGHRDAVPTHPAQVLFYAKIFLKGRDVSFVELSDFAAEEGAWRYVGGKLKRMDELVGPLEAVSFVEFDD